MKDKVDLAKGWFSKADSDLAAARLTLAASGPRSSLCCPRNAVRERVTLCPESVART